MTPSGKRDGAFVVFKGWDVPGNDVAYYADLKGDVDRLKDVVMSKPGSQFYAFNTNGVVKAWTILDTSKFIRTTHPACDLYIRVEYPGWHFEQGFDSSSHDIRQITDVSTANSLIGRIAELYTDDEENLAVAAFNTNGWVKSKVTRPLVKWPGPTTTGLEGIYIRTESRSYSFFPLHDSVGHDISERRDAANDLPELIRICSEMDQASGFNTDGCIKDKLTIPPTTVAYTSPTQGLYLRVVWPDFIYLPGLDSPSNNIRQVTGKQVRELIDEARRDPQVVAFSTDGWMKSDVSEMPTDFPTKAPLHSGIYVKVLDASTIRATGLDADAADSLVLNVALFALKGTAIIWGKWFLADAAVRVEYNKAVAAASKELLQDVRSGKLSPSAAAEAAHNARNNFLVKMRQKTSPAGLVVAQGLKPAGGSYEFYLNKYANSIYGKAFAELSREEAVEVSIATIKSAGRANPKVNKVMNGLGKLSKALLVLAAAVSVYQVTVADDWKYELGMQVSSWSASIAAGTVGAGVGSLVGPVGAIIGGIAGSIIGGLAGEGAYSALASWFFGSTSGHSGAFILGPMLEDARVHVEGRIKSTRKNFYIHLVLASHMSTESTNQVHSTLNAKEVVNVVKPQEPDSEVIATIVWIETEDGFLPTNAANPADLIILMEWAAHNHPQDNASSLCHVM